MNHFFISEKVRFYMESYMEVYFVWDFLNFEKKKDYF